MELKEKNYSQVKKTATKKIPPSITYNRMLTIISKIKNRNWGILQINTIMQYLKPNRWQHSNITNILQFDKTINMLCTNSKFTNMSQQTKMFNTFQKLT